MGSVHASVVTCHLEKMRLASGQAGSEAGEGPNYLHPSRQTSPGMLHTDTQHTLQDGLSELPSCEPYVTAASNGCAELQNFSLEVALSSSNGNGRYLNTNIPVTDGNRPKKDNLTSTRNETCGFWRTGAGFFSTLLSANYPIWYSNSLSASIFPGANSSIHKPCLFLS